jgi:hypothetical protein
MSGSGNWLTIADVRAREEQQRIAHSRTSSFLCKSEFVLDMLALQQRISLLDQPFKLFGLLCDPVRVSSFILGARECSGLFNQLPDVVTNNRDALFEFQERKRTTVAHDVFPGQALTRGSAGETTTAQLALPRV